MQTTGIFTIFNYKFKVKQLNKPIYLFPFGDIHRDSPNCHVEKWLEFLEWARKKENSYFLGMGDYTDLSSTSERKILTNPDLHESTKTTFENVFRKNTERLVKEIGFMKGKLIGLIEGNHYGTFPSGMTTTMLMADKLETKYLGVSSFIRLSFEYGNHRNYSIDIWGHHGKGAARLTGGSINRVQQMGECAEADIYLMGHDHKKGVTTTTKLRLSAGRDLRLSHRKQLYIRTGSFLKGYEDAKASYIVDNAMNPTDLGVVKIELTPKRKCIGKTDVFYIDLHASI